MTLLCLSTILPIIAQSWRRNHCIRWVDSKSCISILTKAIRASCAWLCTQNKPFEPSSGATLLVRVYPEVSSKDACWAMLKHQRFEMMWTPRGRAECFYNQAAWRSAHSRCSCRSIHRAVRTGTSGHYFYEHFVSDIEKRFVHRPSSETHDSSVILFFV